MTVAFITDAPRVAGSEVWLRDLLPLLPAHRVQPTLFAPRHETLHRWRDELRASGVEVINYAHLSEVAPRTTPFDLRVVQAWEPASYRTLLPALAAPRLVVSHDQLDYHYAPPLRALYREIYRWTKAGPLRSADAVLTVSHWGAEFLQRQMGLPALAMRNGVDPDKFRPAPPQAKRQLRSRFGFQRFTALVPGRFTLEKNQLSAFLAARHAPEVDFVFVGDMDSGFGELAGLMQRRWRLTNVRFLGRRWDMPELYRAADVLLQPTLAENQSLVTLEAMSSGLPLVTTEIAAQRELVRDGVDGLCLPVQPRLIATALRALARHPDKAQAYGRNGRSRVLQRHTAQGSAAQLAAMLRAQAMTS